MKLFSRAVLIAFMVAASVSLQAQPAQGDAKEKSGRSGGSNTAASTKSDAKTGAKADEKLPSATEILERYAKAIGGKEAFAKHKSQHAKGTVQMKAQGVDGTMEVFAARPNKLLLIMKLGGIGEFTTGFDGKVGWLSSALTGPMLLEGKMLEQVATQADFDHTLHDPAGYTTKEVLGIEEFNGEECYKLRLSHKTGFDSTEFFSTETGLQIGFISTQESPLGPVTATTTVSEYKKFGDLYMPSRVTQKVAGMETVQTIAEMTFDDVPPATFELPAEVKALLEKPAADPASGNGEKNGTDSAKPAQK